jgi:hypothetical protein
VVVDRSCDGSSRAVDRDSRRTPWADDDPRAGPAPRDLRRDARQHSDRLDRDEQAGGQPHVGRGRARRRRIGHVPGVDLVEPAEVLDVGVEDRRLGHVGHGRAGGGEHGGEVDQRLLGLRLDPLRDLARRGVDPCARAEDQAAGDDRLAIRPERGRGLIARHCPSCHRPLLLLMDSLSSGRPGRGSHGWRLRHRVPAPQPPPTRRRS